MASKAYKADSDRAKKAVYDAHGEGECPFDEGTRLHRLWRKWRIHYWDMEYLMA